MSHQASKSLCNLKGMCNDIVIGHNDLGTYYTISWQGLEVSEGFFMFMRGMEEAKLDQGVNDNVH